MATFFKQFSLLSCLLFSFSVLAQTTITGKVVDKKDGTPLPYVYLKIDKFALGTVTEGDGKFRITIPQKYDAYTIVFSYVGYEDLQLKVADFRAKNGGNFAMTSATNLLTEVVVKPKKMPRPRALLRKVIKKIPKNYANSPTMITGYYRETMKENGEYIKFTDAACNYYSMPYSNKKYKRKDYQSVLDFMNSDGSFSIDFANTLHRVHFHHQTLKGEQAHIINARSSSNLSKLRFYANIEGGPLSLFARNRVKYQQSFLGKKRNGDFEYTISEAQDKDGTWLYVLDFHTQTTRPFLESISTPSNNRQWRVANKHKLLKGKIYIDQNDLAIVRYECSVPNQLKQYFCGVPDMDNKHFDYKLDIRFKKTADKYYIDQLRHEDEFLVKDTVEKTTTYYAAISEFKTLDIVTKGVKKFPAEENFANVMSNPLYEYALDYDSLFWQNYTKENPVASIDSTIRQDMEVEKTLEIQFRNKHIRNDSMPAPIAKIEPTSFNIHGEKYLDNYAWLKDTKAPKQNKSVIDYLRQENKYTENYFIPLRKSQRNIYKELIKSVEKNSTSIPTKENGYFYYSQYSEEEEYPIYYRKASLQDTIAQELLNVNELAIGKDYFDAGVGSASPNNQLIAVYENTTGKDEYVLKFKDLTTNTFLTDSITGIGDMEWLDNRTFLYVDLEKKTLRSSKVLRHTLGTNPKNDTVIYEEKDPKFSVGINKSKSKEYLFLSTSSNTSSETWILKTDNPTGQFTVIRPRENNHLYDVYHHQNQFYIITNKNALNNKVVTLDTHNISKGKWRDLIPHQAGVLIEDMAIFDNHLVIQEKENAQSQIKIIDQTTKKSHFIKVKEDFYNISIDYNPDFQTDSLQFSYSSFETPSTTYKYHMATKEKGLVKQHSKPITHPFYKYVIERKWVIAKDGKKIPLTLISHKWRAKRKGNNHKVYLTSYGAYGAGQGLVGGPTVHHLVNAGYVYAIAHIRGGDDMGREWYEDGKLLNKKNTFTDFIACAEHLITEGYAKKGSIVAEGGSAGGLLMGAVVNARPELFNTVILDVPFVDVINTMLDEKLPLTVSEFEEWGNPKKKKYYEYIKSYSPYDNVKAQNYPNLLYFTGLNDTRVGYWEPAKMVAKLRATKTDDNILLLKTDFSAGHGGGSGRYAGFRDSAYRLALIYELYREPKEN